MLGEVNQSLSNYSDVAFQSAFIIYAVALVVSLLYYGRMQVVINTRRLLVMQEAEVAEPVAARVGAGEDVVDEESGDSRAERAVVADGAESLAKEEARANKLAGMTQALVWAGILVHLLSVVLRGVATSRFPLGNLYEYMLVMTLGVFVVMAVALTNKSWRTLWPWLLTPMLILMFYGATKLYAQSAPVVPALQSHWLPIHVTTVVLGASIGMVSGVLSLLYLLRLWQAPGSERGFFGMLAKPLPSAKRLDSLAYKTGIVTLPVFGLGILLGAIWAESAWSRFWGWDPKETVSFVTWILYAAYLHARATAGWKAWGAAIINVVALATMIFNLFFINLVVSGLHSYAGLN